MTDNRGGRPPHDDAPREAKYDFRLPGSLKAKFLRHAGLRAPSVLIQLISWWIGDADELPERPQDRRAA